MNRDLRNQSKPEYLIQVQLRFCLLETTCEQEDYFPPNVQLKVNGKMCQLPVSFYNVDCVIAKQIKSIESNCNKQTWS